MSWITDVDVDCESLVRLSLVQVVLKVDLARSQLLSIEGAERIEFPTGERTGRAIVGLGEQWNQIQR